MASEKGLVGNLTLPRYAYDYLVMQPRCQNIYLEPIESKHKASILWRYDRFRFDSTYKRKNLIIALEFLIAVLIFADMLASAFDILNIAIFLISVALIIFTYFFEDI
ncbi:MAG: hypothetical protein ACE5OZ_23170 [Candidatus Heimdallarchaeota archaeon]